MGGWETTGEDWMGAPAAARYMGINLRTLYSILDTGDLPAYKLGRVIRLKREEVDAYLERCRVQPGSLSHLYPPGEDGDPPKEALVVSTVQALRSHQASSTTKRRPIGRFGRFGTGVEVAAATPARIVRRSPVVSPPHTPTSSGSAMA